MIYDGLVYVAVGEDPEHGEGVGHLWCIDPTKARRREPRAGVQLEGPEQADSRTSGCRPSCRRKATCAAESELGRRLALQRSRRNGDKKVDFEETMHRTVGSVAIKDDILYIADFSGLFHCLDAKTGKPHWTYDMLAATWGSPLIVDGKVYIGDEDGDVAIFRHSADPKVAMKDVAKEGEEPKWCRSTALEPDDGQKEINMGNSVYSTPIVAGNVLYIANRTHLFAIANERE